MRAVAQVLGTYILCDDGATLTVLDMHAAHERLRYEELKRAAAGKATASQALLFPQRVEFAVAEAQSVGEHLDTLRRLGFEMEAFGGGSFLITETPAMLRPGQVEPVLRDLAVELREHGSADSLDALTDRLLITMACHHVLRSGDRVDAGEMQALVDRLLECPNADTCPHGRPTWIRFTRGNLERLFKRTGF
jgi:DNA mismatch repair protein MutL